MSFIRRLSGFTVCASFTRHCSHCSSHIATVSLSGWDCSGCMFFVIFNVLKLNCVFCCRGNQAYAEGQLTKAEECYTHGIDCFSPNEVSRKALMLCYSNRAATRMSLGKMREALSDCRAAIDIDSSFLKSQGTSQSRQVRPMR